MDRLYQNIAQKGSRFFNYFDYQSIIEIKLTIFAEYSQNFKKKFQRTFEYHEFKVKTLDKIIGRRKKSACFKKNFSKFIFAFWKKIYRTKKFVNHIKIVLKILEL